MSAPSPAFEIGTHLVDMEISIELTLKNELAKRLVEHAERLNREPCALLADIVERVLTDDLVDAVLDEPALMGCAA